MAAEQLRAMREANPRSTFLRRDRFFPNSAKKPIALRADLF